MTTATHTDFDELFEHANKQIAKSDPESIKVVEKLMQAAMRDSSPHHFAKAQYIFAHYNCMIAHDHDSVIASCTEMLDGITENGLAYITHKLYIIMGNSYYYKGELDMAQQAFLNGVRYLESMPAEDDSIQKSLGFLYHNLAQLIVASDPSDLNEDAESYIYKSIGLLKRYELTTSLTSCYYILSNIYHVKGETSKSIEILQDAVATSIQANNQKGVAFYNANLAEIYIEQGQYEKAYSHINESLVFYNGASHLMFDTARVKGLYGKLLCITGFLKDGINELQNAAEVLEKFDSKNELMRIYETLATYLAETGDLESAYRYQRKYTEGVTRRANVDKKVTQTRRETNANTESIKEAETLKVRNDEMLKYIGQLESSNNSLQQFAHITSHDLREPLRMISAYTGLLKKSLDNVLDNEQAEFMEYISGGTTRMQNLINDLLRLAKVGSDPVVEKVDIMEIAEEVKMNIKVLLEEKNAEVNCAAQHVVLADRAMMLQLFQNLIGNGIKYNESTYPTVRVESKIVGNALEIKVIDNGIGIPEHLRQKAFELFQRLHTDKQYTGTGIGLAICKKIAEAMAGWIQIDDNPGGGSIFSVWFPLTAVDMS